MENYNKGFSLIEFIIVLAIISTLASIAIPAYSSLTLNCCNKRAISEIRNINIAVRAYQTEKGILPASMRDISLENLRDPWGNLYHYQPVTSASTSIQDRFGNALNSEYDLYSFGQDSTSTPIAGSQINNDDIVLAGNGDYIGIRP